MRSKIKIKIWSGVEAVPEEVEAEEGDGPAVVVLGVHSPLDAHLVEQDKPEPGKRQEAERKAQGASWKIIGHKTAKESAKTQGVQT